MYDLPAILRKIEGMEAQGMAHNAAAIEAVRILYPKDFQEMTAICKEKGTAPETEIPALIEFLKNELVSPGQGNAPAAKKGPGADPPEGVFHVLLSHCLSMATPLFR